MASEYDPAEFIDNDFRATRQPGALAATAQAAAHDLTRAPSREEVEARVNDMQSKLG